MVIYNYRQYPNYKNYECSWHEAERRLEYYTEEYAPIKKENQGQNIHKFIINSAGADIETQDITMQENQSWSRLVMDC